MSYTPEQLEAIEKAIAAGSRRVKYSDQEIEYRSLDEMRSIRNEMRADLGMVSRNTRAYPEFSRGISR